MIDRFLDDVFVVLYCPFWSTVLFCSVVLGADTHLTLLDCAVSGARFLTGGVFDCNIAHRRSVAVLCMLYEIRCNLMHPVNGALTGPYVPVRVTRGALVAHRYTCAPPRYRTSQYSRTFIPLSVSLWNDIADRSMVWDHRTMVWDHGVGPPDQYSMVWDWWVSRAGPMLLDWPKLLYPYYCLLFFPFSSFCLSVGIVGLGSSD